MSRIGLAMMGIASCLAVSAAGGGESVVGWRTDWTGRYPDTTPPTEWSADKNVVWKTPMPSWSNATPVIVGEKIFVCSEPADLICVSRSDGKILWRKSNAYEDVLTPEQLAQAEADAAKAKPLQAELRIKRGKLKASSRRLKKDRGNAELKKQVDELSGQVKELNRKLAPFLKYTKPKTNKVNGYSSPTPVTDGKSVYVVNGLGVAACYDLDGSRKWATLVDRPTHGYGHSSSPVLVGDKVYVNIVKGVALDAATGKEVWRSDSKGVGLWGTAVPVKVGGTDLLISPNGDVIRVSDGKIVASKLGKLTYATPLVDKGIVYFVQGKGGQAVKLPEQFDEKLACEKLWRPRINPDRYYASAVLHDGLLYAITRKCVFSVVDAVTGKTVYIKKLDLGKGEPYSSITLGGKNVYISNDNGTTLVIEPGRQYKELVKNKVGTFRSSPVFAGTRMYLRTRKSLYCIGR